MAGASKHQHPLRTKIQSTGDSNDSDAALGVVMGNPKLMAANSWTLPVMVNSAVAGCRPIRVEAMG